MLTHVSYMKISRGVYSVFYRTDLRGHVISSRSGWFFIPVFGRYVYHGLTRDDAVAPVFDFCAWKTYRLIYPNCDSAFKRISPLSGEDK